MRAVSRKRGLGVDIGICLLNRRASGSVPESNKADLLDAIGALWFAAAAGEETATSYLATLET